MNANIYTKSGIMVGNIYYPPIDLHLFLMNLIFSNLILQTWYRILYEKVSKPHYNVQSGAKALRSYDWLGVSGCMIADTLYC